VEAAISAPQQQMCLKQALWRGAAGGKVSAPRHLPQDRGPQQGALMLSASGRLELSCRVEVVMWKAPALWRRAAGHKPWTG